MGLGAKIARATSRKLKREAADIRAVVASREAAQPHASASELGVAGLERRARSLERKASALRRSASKKKKAAKKKKAKKRRG